MLNVRKIRFNKNLEVKKSIEKNEESIKIDEKTEDDRAIERLVEDSKKISKLADEIGASAAIKKKRLRVNKLFVAKLVAQTKK
jgi:hypothetical protein